MISVSQNRLHAHIRHDGVSIVELALVAPIFILLLFGLIIGGMGVFRYNQVASLAREGARVASVRGIDYAREMEQPAATAESIHADVIRPRSAGLDPSRLTTTVTWDHSNAPKHVADDMTTTTNHVIVTVTYRWQPEALIGQEFILASTSRMPMSH